VSLPDYVSTSTYTEFQWSSTGPGNGESGVKLARTIIKLVTELSDVRTICDLGCGNGYITSRLSSLNYKTIGVDASESGVNIARTTYPEVVFLRSLIDRSLRTTTGLSQIDLVISSDVIEHLYRPADLFEAALSLLKPKGHIVITTPYHGYLKNLALAITGKLDSHFSALDDGGHIKFFSVKTLSDLMERNGFDNLKFRFYGRSPWLWKNMICHGRRKS